MTQSAVELKKLTLNVFLVIASVLFPAKVFAEDAIEKGNALAPLPPELLYNGKPIEPYCFASFETPDHAEIDITDCLHVKIRRRHGDKVIFITPDSMEYRKDGFIGYSYTYGDDYHGPYIYYKYLGKINELPTLAIENGGGGSGHFSSIISVRREGNTIVLAKEFASGDRCEGEITDSGVKDGHLFYTQEMTPYAFLVAAGYIDSHLHGKQFEEQYEYYNLNDSPPACYGEAHYEDGKLLSVALIPGAAAENDFMKPNGQKDGKMTYILNTKEELAAARKKNRGDYEENTHQECFDNHYLDYLTRGKTILTIDKLKEFMHIFTTQCIDSQMTQ